jgi:hypothetical protein
MGKKAVLFWKKEPKTFSNLGHRRGTRAGANLTKVFASFFQK